MADQNDFATAVGALIKGATARLAALEYDSGVRNVAQAFLSAHTTHTSNITLQRVGRRVDFSLYVRPFDKAGAPAGTVLFTLPAGFRPQANYRVAAVAPAGVLLNVLNNGQVVVAFGEIPAGSFVTLNFGHTTGPELPLSLPGSAA